LANERSDSELGSDPESGSSNGSSNQLELQGSPALSLLLKLTACLSPGERTELARLLASDGDQPPRPG
jgi:hypothetical protein